MGKQYIDTPKLMNGLLTKYQEFKERGKITSSESVKDIVEKINLVLIYLDEKKTNYDTICNRINDDSEVRYKNYFPGFKGKFEKPYITRIKDGKLKTEHLKETGIDVSYIDTSVQEKENFHQLLIDLFEIKFKKDRYGNDLKKIESSNITEKDTLKNNVQNEVLTFTFICYLWRWKDDDNIGRKRGLDYYILKLIIDEKNLLSYEKKQGGIKADSVTGEVFCYVFDLNRENTIRHINNGNFEIKNNLYIEIESKNTYHKTYFTFKGDAFSILRSRNIDFSTGTYIIDLSDGGTACGLAVLERQNNFEEAELKIKNFNNFTSQPHEQIYNFLYHKRFIVNRQTTDIESLPSNNNIERIAIYSGFYKAFIMNTRVKAIEQLLFYLNPNGQLLVVDERGKGNFKITEGYVKVLDLDQYNIIVLHFEYIENNDEFRSRAILQDGFIEKNDNGKYLQGVLNGFARRNTNKPTFGRIELKKIDKEIANFNKINTLNDKNINAFIDVLDDEDKPQFYLISEKNTERNIKFESQEKDIFDFFWGYQDEIKYKGLGPFGESVVFYNDIVKKYPELRYKEKTDFENFHNYRFLQNSKWKAYYYQEYIIDERKNIYEKGIAVATLFFDEFGMLEVNILSKESQSLVEVFNGNLNLDKSDTFIRTRSNAGKSKLSIQVKFFDDDTKAIGLYYRSEEDEIFSGKVVLESYKENCDTRFKPKLLKNKKDFEGIDEAIRIFLERDGNTIGIKPAFKFKLPSIKKKYIKPIKCYVCVPQSAIDDIDRRKELKDLEQEIKEKIEKKYQQKYQDSTIEIKTVHDLVDANNGEDETFIMAGNTYGKLKESLKDVEKIIMIYPEVLAGKKSNILVSQSSILIIFGMCLAYSIPIYLFYNKKIEHNELPVLIRGAEEKDHEFVTVKEYDSKEDLFKTLELFINTQQM